MKNKKLIEELKDIERFIKIKKEESLNKTKSDFGLFLYLIGAGIALLSLIFLNDVLFGISGVLLCLLGYAMIIDCSSYKTRLELIKKGYIKGNFYDLEDD